MHLKWTKQSVAIILSTYNYYYNLLNLEIALKECITLWAKSFCYPLFFSRECSENNLLSSLPNILRLFHVSINQ